MAPFEEAKGESPALHMVLVSGDSKRDTVWSEDSDSPDGHDAS